MVPGGAGLDDVDLLGRGAVLQRHHSLVGPVGDALGEAGVDDYTYALLAPEQNADRQQGPASG